MEALVIPISELTPDSRHYHFDIGKAFFDSFENSEIKDAELTIDADIIDDGSISVHCAISGSVTVECDLCLEDLVLPVDTSFDEDDYEPTNVLDLRQDVYDYVCISLPMQRVHPDGECNPEAIKHLSR